MIKKWVKGISRKCNVQDKGFYCRRQYLLWCCTSNIVNDRCVMSTIFFTYVKDPRIIAVRFLLIPVSLFYSEIDACFAFVDFSLHSCIVRGADYYYSILLLTIIYYIILYYIQYYNTQNKVTIGMQGELIHAVSYIARANTIRSTIYP